MNNTLIVFNFNCTLTTNNIFDFLNGKLEIKSDTIDINELKKKLNEDTIIIDSFLDDDRKFIIENFFGGNERLDKLEIILKKLKKYYYEIIIASNTKKNIIVLLLKFSNLFSLFDHIYGREDIKAENLGINGLLSDKINSKQYKYLYYFDHKQDEHKFLLEKYKIVGPKLENNFISANLNNVEYHFFETLSKSKDCKGLSILNIDYLSDYIIENSIITIPITKNKCKKYNNTHTSSISHNKYLKYKQKYLDLKKLL